MGGGASFCHLQLFLDQFPFRHSSHYYGNHVMIVTTELIALMIGSKSFDVIHLKFNVILLSQNTFVP